MRKSIEARYVSSCWLGDRTGLSMTAVVVAGPDAFLDRRVRVDLHFDEVEKMYKMALEARRELTASDAKLKAVNDRNAE